MVKKANSRFLAGNCYKPLVKGTFSFTMGLPDIYSGQPSIKKTGRGSCPFSWALASSSYSPYCKGRKEVMRQR
jgi:hypothetical protein